MKKYFIISILLFFSLYGQSQVLIALLLGDKLNSGKLEFGLEGGLNWSSISGMETNNLAGHFNLGFYFDIKLQNQWALYTGVLVKSNLGVDKLTVSDLDFLKATISEDYEGTYRQITQTFMVPCFAKYNFKNHFYVEAGPEFGLNYKGWVEFQSDVEGIEVKSKEKNSEMLQKLDVGVGAGLGYKLLKGTGWTLGVKYYHGFVDVYKDRSGTKHSSINLKLNIPIGAGEKKKSSE